MSAVLDHVYLGSNFQFLRCFFKSRSYCNIRRICVDCRQKHLLKVAIQKLDTSIDISDIVEGLGGPVTGQLEKSNIFNVILN